MPESATTLALDHLTVVDTLPVELVRSAGECGCRAICLFLESMAVLPRMPAFSLLSDRAAREATRRSCEDWGLKIDLAYPFTLTGRTEARSFLPAMETAASLAARTLNVLLYDRDPERRFERFAAFCELAVPLGLSVAVEFYPLAQVRSLREALELVARVNRPGVVGVNVDLLHLVRSGGGIEEVAAAPPGAILYAQYCDAPRELDADAWGWEASYQRLVPGEGQLEVGRFSEALPADVRCSVEVPQEREILRGLPQRERALRAIKATRRSIGV